jgi:monoamine oxidase
MVHDAIVIGGGIAGVRASLGCCEMGMSVCTIERDSRWGGRIRSIHRDGEVYDAGAGRFHASHRRVMLLIRRYKIETVSLGNRPRQYRSVRCSQEAVKSPAYELIHRIVDGSKGYSASFLRGITFGEFAEMVVGMAGRQLAQAAFGYDGEFDVINAYDGLRMFQHDFASTEAFYTCKDGLGAIVGALVKDLEKHKNWTGVLEHRVANIQHTDGVYTVMAVGPDGKKTTYKGRSLVLAIPRQALLDLGMWNAEQLAMINAVEGVPCTRIYARYKTPWFHGLPITTTDIPIRQFIPISERLAMVSYSDSLRAKKWGITAGQGTEMLEKRVHRGLRELFPERRIPRKPDWIEAYYWDNAIHMWRPGMNSGTIGKRLTSGGLGTRLYVCGEAYSRRQCWIEGALQTAEDVLKQLAKDIRGGADWRGWVRENTNSKGEMPRGKLKELLQLYPDAKWVLFKNRLIDLTEWYYNHPGGQTPYDNHMHKNVYPFFRHVSNHYDGSNIKSHVMKKIETLTIAIMT